MKDHPSNPDKVRLGDRPGGAQPGGSLLAGRGYRLMLFAALTMLLLVGLLGVQLYRVAWQEALREVNDKHRVLAVNLAAAVADYVQDRRYTVASIAAGLSGDSPLRERLAAEQADLLSAFQRGVEGIRSLTLLDGRGRVLRSGELGRVTPAATRALAQSSVFYHVIASGGHYQAGVAASPFDGLPSVTLGWPVRGQGGRLAAVLLTELSTGPIETLRARVRFGEDGHAMIVDQRGRVLAHPSPQWVREMRDLSGLKIVQTVLAGGSGVSEFHSPYADKRMVAGYAAVPGAGWGVIVPQPKQEIASRVRATLYAQLWWALLALGLLALLAYLVVLWMTRPLQRLASRVDTRRDASGRRDPPP